MNRIAELRKGEKLNQKELGSIVGVAQNTICNWENGKREPDHASLIKMADYFGVSVDFLLGRDEEMPAPTEEDGQDELEQLLMQYVREMTPDQKKLLLAQMQVLAEQNEQ